MSGSFFKNPVSTYYRIALAVCLTGLSSNAWALSRMADSTEFSIQVNRHYLNIPIGAADKMLLIDLNVAGPGHRTFPVQLAQAQISYWIYLDISEFKGKTITLKCLTSKKALSRIYQDDRINGADSLYKESNRPTFHFTVKRGWSNDINGPIFYEGTYHLFWQAFPFGLIWNTGFMYWGHATSKDLLHWTELSPALMLDSLGSPWSGTAVIDTRNAGGWGNNALVLFYTAFDRKTEKEVQCIAYSTNGGATFTRYAHNPVIDSNDEMGTTQTRDPKVFWYAPGNHWVMVLFEKDGMSIYNSVNLRTWTKKSHVAGLHECPDLFELPVRGNEQTKKWVLHGGSSEYFIGSFNGETFKPETPKMRYAESSGSKQRDLLYAAESFTNMPQNRRVQMAWGRIEHPGMPFTQMMLFPTEFHIAKTAGVLKLCAEPIAELSALHQTARQLDNLSVKASATELKQVTAGPLQAKFIITIPPGSDLSFNYQGKEFFAIKAGELPAGKNLIELLIDKSVAEIFINHGERYIIKSLPAGKSSQGLSLSSGTSNILINHLEMYTLKSIWATDT